MKLFRSIFGAFAVCLFPVICFGYGVTVVGPTSPVEVGQQYTITAGLQVRNQSEIPQSITITRDGQTLAQSVSSTQYTCPGESTGGQTVTYSVRGVYRNGTVVGQNYSVTVNAPPSHPPTVEWQTTQTHGVFGEEINIVAIGHDVDGDLSGVHIWKDGQPFAFELKDLLNGTPQNYGAWAGRKDPMPNEIRAVHYYVQAEDLAGNKSDWVDLYIDVKSANQPVLDSFTVSMPYIYQTTNIVVTAHDPDSDLKSINIIFALGGDLDNPKSPDTAFPGVYRLTHTGSNHHNKGPNKSVEPLYLQFWDWSGNETWLPSGFSITTDNRAPLTPTFTATKTTIVIGGSVTLATAGHDDDGNMTGQKFVVQKYIGPGPNDYGPPIPIPDFTDANGVYDHTLTTDWTPTETGTYRIYGRSNDPDAFADSSYIIVTTTPPPPPNPPTDFKAGTPVAATIPLTWTPSTSDHIGGYILTWGPVGGEQKAYALAPYQTGYIASLLSPGVTYQFVLQAKNELGIISEATPTVTATAAKLSQSITFPNPGNQTYNTPFPQTAYSSSGLAISYSISGPVVIEGANFRANGVGPVTITAKQAGNSVYDSAQEVSQTFIVNQASQTLLFYNPGTHTYGDPAFDLGATVNSGLPISYSVTGPATRVGSMLTVTGAGTVSVTASQAGNENYLPVSIMQTFTVNRASQTITFAGPSEHTYGDAPFDLVASASSNLLVSFSVVGGPASVSGARLTISGAGTVTVRASQGGDTDHYQQATNVDRTFNVKKATQTITFNNPGPQVAGTSLALTASASSGLTVTFAVESGPATVSVSTLSLNGVGTVKVVASQAGDTNYNVATSVPQSFLVSAATQPTVSISPNSGTVALGGSLTFTASGGSTGNYTWGGTAGASGTDTATTKTVQFNSLGDKTVTVFSPADATHAQSNIATATITVGKSPQSNVSISPTTLSVNQGESVTFTASGGGVGGYTWGGTGGATGSGPSTTKTVSFATEGNFTVTVQSPGDDSTGGSNTATAQVTVTKILTPVVSILPSTAQTVTVGDSITFTSTATDADGNMTDHNLDWLCPDGNWNWQGGQGATSDVDPTANFWQPKGTSTRSVTLTFNLPGTFKAVWYAQDPAGWVPSATVQVTVRAGVILSDISDTDDDNDGVPDAIEQKLGITPANVHLFRLEYDKINQLKSGAFGQYIKDAEGNIKQVRN